MHSRSRDRGFALLITITLLAFLVLLLVSLSSLTRVETQVASNGQQLAQARQNALFALNVALGQLQTTAGPDQRVTACAEVLPTTNATNAKWTGVWDSNITDLAGTTTPPAPWQSLGLAKPVWLVSQANSTVNAADITQAITLPAGSYGNTTYVEMVGTGSVGTSAPTGSTVVVPVTPITIAANQVPGLSGTANATIGRFGYWVGDEGVKARINLPNPNATKTDTLSLLNQLGTAQSSAWNLFSGSTSPTPAATDPATVISTAMLNASGQMLGAGQLPLLASADGSAPAGAAAALTQIGTSRFHDYTLYSAGVQSDVRDGGLKWDLSSAFDLSTNWGSTEFSLNAPSILDSASHTISPVKSTVTGLSGETITPTNETFAFLPQVTYTNAGASTISYLRGPTWSLLRSHAELYQTQNPTSGPTTLLARGVYPGGIASGLGGQSNIPSLYEINSGYSGGVTDPNTNYYIAGTTQLVPRPSQASIAPYINRVFIRFGLRTVPAGSGGTVTASDGSTDTNVYAVQLVMTPIVILHNPYDVPVTFYSYTSNNNASLPAGTPPIAAQINLFSSTGHGLPLSLSIQAGGFNYMTGSAGANNGAGPSIISLGANAIGNTWPRFKLLIPGNITLAAGEVKVLYPQTPTVNQDVNIIQGATDYTYITLNTAPANLQGGFVFPWLNGDANKNDSPYPSSCSSSLTVCPPILAAVTGGTVTTLASGATGLTPVQFAGNVTAAGVGSAAEIWCHGSDTLQAKINSSGGDFEIKYSVESATPAAGTGSIASTSSSTGSSTDNAATGNTDNSTLTYQLDGFAPPYPLTSTGYDAYVGAYTTPPNPPSGAWTSNWTNGNVWLPSGGGLTASNCSTSDKYFFALDFYVKPADQDAARATRPFVTSNPVAFEQFSTALGGQTSPTSSNGTSGFPHVMPAYQIDYLSLDPSSSADLTQHMSINTTTSESIWGPHNGSDGQSQSYLDGSSQGLSIIPLIHIPTRPLASIADLQHANIALYGYQPYFAVGNSYASPYIPASSFLNPVGYSAPSGGSGANAANPYFLYDLSYLMNSALWDKYYFSTLSQQWNGSSWNTGDTALQTTLQSWANGNLTPADTRMALHLSPTASIYDNLGNTTVSPIKADYRKIAANLLTLGSFNINSRSVDAWAAVLGAARGLSVEKNQGGSLSSATMPGGTSTTALTPIPRLLPATAQSDSLPLSQNTWTGFVALTDAQIRQLAANIVAEITRRQTGTITTMTGIANPATASYTGPFRSLADFINRNLSADLSAIHPTGATGVIQAGLDEHTNANSPNYRFFTGSTYRDASSAQGNAQWAFNWNGSGSNALAGAGPTSSTAQGFLLQADVLQQIGPFLSARSDTFTIRTYGECMNPITGVTTGKAWCEAVVQRLPEYVDQTDPALSSKTYSTSGSYLATQLGDAVPPYNYTYSKANATNGTVTTTALLNSNNLTYGRRFKIVSFRWLAPQDL